MAGLARVVVHVRRGGAGGPARFGQSVTGTFCPAHEDAAVVSCGLDGGRFLLSDMPFPGSTVALLKRPSFCPAKRLGEQPELALPAELRGRGVAAGVAVLLQASTGRVLLTRRAGTLSIFPNVWVPPAAGRGAAGAGGGDGAAPGSGDLLLEDARPLGGNVRLGWGGSAPPPLPDGAGHPWVRGAAPGRCLPPPTDTAAPARGAGGWPWGPLPSSSVSPQSVYPPMLSRGLPRRHHIVTYLLLLSAESHEQLEARMRPSESEHHGAEHRLLQHRPAPDRDLPEHGSGRRGGRGTGQHRHQVRPSALAGVPRGAGASLALGQPHAAPAAAGE
ncbi:nucleoside diphosphate-linked moiety X motif 17 isoform X2 [Ciconia boyciana]|uniref:nucleoside diphosphate-linked moiety X motif 17 isoform X2 n=1 Tax=Ciconia boyciana TaxID=52775 RepID=UPI003B9F195E